MVRSGRPRSPVWAGRPFQRQQTAGVYLWEFAYPQRPRPTARSSSRLRNKRPVPDPARAILGQSRDRSSTTKRPTGITCVCGQRIQGVSRLALIGRVAETSTLQDGQSRRRYRRCRDHRKRRGLTRKPPQAGRPIRVQVHDVPGLPEGSLPDDDASAVVKPFLFISLTGIGRRSPAAPPW